MPSAMRFALSLLSERRARIAVWTMRLSGEAFGGSWGSGFMVVGVRWGRWVSWVEGKVPPADRTTPLGVEQIALGKTLGAVIGNVLARGRSYFQNLLRLRHQRRGLPRKSTRAAICLGEVTSEGDELVGLALWAGRERVFGWMVEQPLAVPMIQGVTDATLNCS